MSSSGGVLVVEGDLMAVARIRSAAHKAGREVTTTSTKSLAIALRKGAVALLVLDLDRGGVELVRAAQSAEQELSDFPRVLAFFSHVDESLGQAAKEAGFETFRRGQFWRSLDELLA